MNSEFYIVKYLPIVYLSLVAEITLTESEFEAEIDGEKIGFTNR